MKIHMTRILTLMLAVFLVIPAFASAAPTTKGSAADLRSALGNLLGEHAILAINTMQKGYDGKADFADAAGALNANTDELSQAIASVYGDEAGKSFNTIWSSHIGYFVDYVKATGAKDNVAKQKAVDNLEIYRLAQAKFFATANPNLNEQELAEGLKMHINELLKAFNSYVAKDYASVYTTEREAYAHMLMTGDALADGIVKQFPTMFTGDIMNNPASDLRQTLGQILGEHASAAVFAMQKGIDGAPDFDQAAAVLTMNTNDLSNAIASIYGADAGKAFNPLWSSHIGYFVDYVKATATKDNTAKQKAVANLEKYRLAQAKFFATANPNLSEQQLADGLKMHINELLKAFDSYVAKDYKTAYTAEREAYAHMFMTGDALSEGIVKQFPAKFETTTPTVPTSPQVSTVTMQLGSKTIHVNNNKMMMDVAPFIKNGSTFIPVRFLAEGIGAKVKYDKTTNTTWIMAGDDKLAFWIGQDTMQLNGMNKKVGATVFVKDGRTEVPLRFITELLGWNVAWGKDKATIIMTKAMAPASAAAHNMATDMTNMSAGHMSH
ncbi:copper amine oxidase N-terminal domain-containing protein [Paenibacillus antarcticus]|uniref:Copper amine oxidase-like N-terminal domain-containing protein n=1 Tax=Paenibacillus antarcticus TaxID=253703 RepID=A0A168NFG0_9BACL|nr:copper amine oxidase N-terminal domain-containing protein [Paenibacillus antarcticus]OAB45741.1 hypothetical protein PBAT_12600 [Paenibacillus antarcticus]